MLSISAKLKFLYNNLNKLKLLCESMDHPTAASTDAASRNSAKTS